MPAGIQPLAIICATQFPASSIDEKPIRNVKELQTLRQTGYLSIGQEIIVTIIRDKISEIILITLEEQPRL